MDLVDPILVIAEKVYNLCNEVKANNKRCKRLGDRVSALTGLVRAVKAQGLDRLPQFVQRVLSELKVSLESAQKLMEKYASSNYLKRIVKAHDLGEGFGSLNERLNDAVQQLALALQIDQRNNLKMFDEAIRRKEDEEDKKLDFEELQNLFQSLVTKESMEAVHSKVDQTQKDVQDIKGILESLRKPSIHLQDIREIRSEELTFDIPNVPRMKTSNSEIYKGQYNKFAVAIKKYTASTSAKEVRNIFKKEVETMKRFESPHILRMFGICIQNENGPNPTYLIVMEYCEKGSLRQVLDERRELSWDIKIRMCLDAAQGVYRLHLSEDKFKVHGCMSSTKFLVASGYRVKLGSFELSKTETSLRMDKNEKISLKMYLSPQQLEDIEHQYDKACEIYSFGIVLWEIATQKVPFSGLSTRAISSKVCVEKVMEPLPDDCPSELKMLIDACRSYDTFQRPNAGALVDKLWQLAQQYEDY